MTDGFVRQADLVHRLRAADLTATVIGIGTIGRQVALQFAANRSIPPMYVRSSPHAAANPS